MLKKRILDRASNSRTDNKQAQNGMIANSRGSKMARENVTSRMQFQVTPGKVEEIKAIMEDCGFDTQKEFFNNAVTLLKWALKHSKEGHSVGAIDPEHDRYFQLEMPFLSYAASANKKSAGPGE